MSPGDGSQESPRLPNRVNFPEPTHVTPVVAFIEVTSEKVTVPRRVRPFQSQFFDWPKIS